MSRSDAYEKAAFDWASAVDINNITREHLFKAYRLNLKPCSSKLNVCKRNCVNNPKCINGLGERRLLTSKNEECSSSLGEEKRNSGAFAGLKNLGATCYVNSLLQVWYHNPFLREAIYKWKPEDDEKEVSAQLNRVVSFSEGSANSFNPVSPVGQLQFIFARLQFSCRCNVDPSQFVKSLQLDVSQQQDAQEFSKLFLTLLEDDLSTQKNLMVKNIVQTQYCGEYDYVTRCGKCNVESKSPSKFYELSLNIRGHKDIHQSLEEFFSPEILEGSNQYYCNNCESKQNVIRTIRLKKCPPYLNLQLLRFIYDRQKGCRRKLNTSINFPVTLDMSKYFAEDVKENTKYTLCAVLVHRGSSAHSGHYIAHIKDRKTGCWFKFNDEKVEKTGENVLKFCLDEVSEDENLQVDTKQTVKFTKGSSDPYMLVYKSASLDDKSLPADDSEEWDIPYYLHAIVVGENSLFEDQLEIAKKERIQNLATNKENQEEMLFIYRKLMILDTEPFEWISKSWLKDWLNSDFKKPIPPVDNSFALCPHNKLSLKSIHAMKCVNSEGASLIYQKYGCQVRLIDCLCRQCVENKVQSIHVKFKIADDSKKISSLLKFSLPLNELSFWIGKESLRCWKQFVLKLSEAANEIIENGDSDSENQPPTQNELTQANCNMEKFDFNFNEEIICEHGKLGSDESYRRLVPMAVWNILKSYFPNAPEFDSNTLPCEECRSKLITEETLKNQYRKLANDQKQQLYDLYCQRNRINPNDLKVGTVYYLLDYQFYLNWKSFIKDPANHETPTIIDNSKLKCIHHRLIYPPNKIDPITRDLKFLILSDSEWTKLLEFYNSNCCITLRAQFNETTQEKIIKCDPPHCEPCYLQLLQNEVKQLLNYQNAKIYVRKIKYDDIHDPSGDAEDDKFDETFTDASHKRLKWDLVGMQVSSQSKSYINDVQIVRRSSRRRKYRDEREFTVSSLQTLLSLKIDIMNVFKVPPYDQNLFLNDIPLKGNDRTLAELNIIPNSLIYLKVDEPIMRGASLIEEDYLKDSAPETGFKGTQLQKC